MYKSSCTENTKGKLQSKQANVPQRMQEIISQEQLIKDRKYPHSEKKEINNHCSLITLNGMISKAKRHELTEQFRKHNSSFCCIQRTYLIIKDGTYLRVKGWKTAFQANRPKKEASIAIQQKQHTHNHRVDQAGWAVHSLMEQHQLPQLQKLSIFTVSCTCRGFTQSLQAISVDGQSQAVNTQQEEAAVASSCTHPDNSYLHILSVFSLR